MAVGVEVGTVADRPGEAEHEVVPSFVGEEQWFGFREEVGRRGEMLDAHSSNSTRTAPPTTRSPSLTCTALTVAAYGETSGVSIFIASITTSGWRAATSVPGSTRTRIT